MSLDLDRVRSALDALPLASDPAFRRLFSAGRLRYACSAGDPDLIDDLSARIACSALRPGAKHHPPTLIVFPDDEQRRPSLLLAAALVMDALASIQAGTAGRVVLHVSSHAGLRLQLTKIRVGGLPLDGVFAQQHERGTVGEIRGLALPGGVHLPGVLSVSSPADPVSLIHHVRPKWVTIDCSGGRENVWLPALFAQANRIGLPVIGWSSSPLSPALSQWIEAGGAMFRWPRLHRTASTRVVDLHSLNDRSVRGEVLPRTLAGENVAEISGAFVTAAEALLAARKWQNGRLSADALSLGWRYLRTLESLSVPLDVWERSASSYWGTSCPSELRRTFERFLEAVRSSPNLHGFLQTAGEALALAEERLRGAEAPLWLGLANLCVEAGTRRRILFPSRARREIFSFCLLARFNVSEDDLRDIGVALGSLGEPVGRASAVLRAADEQDLDTDSVAPLLVGLPSRSTEKHLEPLLEANQQLEILLWPHQERILAWRIASIARSLRLFSYRLGWLNPALEGPADEITGHERESHLPGLTLGRARVVAAGALRDDLRRRADAVKLWKRPDQVEAIASLFDTTETSEEEETHAQPLLLDEGDGRDDEPELQSLSWVQEAVQLRFEDGRTVLLPNDETVNVVVSRHGAYEVEQRYVRAVRVGDEVLFIQGQRRQSLYDLLVSRVHRDPVIAQYLALVRRWQDDLVQAFGEAERSRGLTPERLLEELQRKGSSLISPHTIRAWLRRRVLAPNDADDLRRVAEFLALHFVLDYYRQIHKAGRRLKGLHINLSARLNRWLASTAGGSMANGEPDNLIDADLGLTMDDFRHSLLRLRVREVTSQPGPFYRLQLGRLDGG